MPTPSVSDSLNPYHNAMACPSCDCLVDLSGLAEGERANCARCGHLLTVIRSDAAGRVLAFSIAAFILLLLSCSFPFLSFQAQGLESVTSLPQTVYTLWLNGMPDLALLVGAFIVGVPAVVIVLVMWMSWLLHRRRYHPWLPGVGRIIFSIQSWAMVEVFFIGVLVSLVKIAKMATVVIGISFWSYGVFFILFTMTLASLDRFQCWREIEELADELN